MSDQQELAPEGLRLLAVRYMSTAMRCEEAANFLKSLMESLYWQSQAATSFRNRISEYIMALAQFRMHFETLASELNQRAAIFEESQRSPNF